MVHPLDVSINRFFKDILKVSIIKVNYKNQRGEVLIDLVANLISKYGDS